MLVWKKRTRALPGSQPGASAISSITSERSTVRSAIPASPSSHCGGAHANRRGRLRSGRQVAGHRRERRRVRRLLAADGNHRDSGVRRIRRLEADVGTQDDCVRGNQDVREAQTHQVAGLEGQLAAAEHHGGVRELTRVVATARDREREGRPRGRVPGAGRELHVGRHGPPNPPRSRGRRSAARRGRDRSRSARERERLRRARRSRRRVPRRRRRPRRRRWETPARLRTHSYSRGRWWRPAPQARRGQRRTSRTDTPSARVPPATSRLAPLPRSHHVRTQTSCGGPTGMFASRSPFAF